MQIDTAQKIIATVSFDQGGAATAAPEAPVWSFEPAGLVDLVEGTEPNTVEVLGMSVGSGTLTMTAGAVTASAPLDIVAAPVPAPLPVTATITFGDAVAK